VLTAGRLECGEIESNISRPDKGAERSARVGFGGFELPCEFPETRAVFDRYHIISPADLLEAGGAGALAQCVVTVW